MFLEDQNELLAEAGSERRLVWTRTRRGEVDQIALTNPTQIIFPADGLQSQQEILSRIERIVEDELVKALET